MAAKATNNLLIDYQCTIMALTKVLLIMIETGKNKCFILQWQNIGNKIHALVTIDKSLVESNIWKLWPAKMFKCIGKRLAVIDFVSEVFIIKVTVK